MKRIIVAAAFSLFAVSALAQGATCKMQATEKKLAGAALKSFMTKCAKDTCEASAKEKKLSGAARDSHIKKCVSDTMGS